MQNELQTSFASAERACEQTINRQKNIFLDEIVLDRYTDALPEVFLILNENRQIVYSNSAISSVINKKPEEIIGMRPGEALFCQHAFESDGGCGTTIFCSTCGAVKAILNSLGGMKDVQECRILLKDTSDALDLRVWATPIIIANENYIVFAIQDIANEKRKGQLEKIFFHDILNAMGGLKGLTELLTTAEPEEMDYFKDLIMKVANQVVEEIQAQRQLMLAENGDLKVFFDTYFVNQTINSVADSYRHHTVAEGKIIEVLALENEIPILTDATILKRVLGNMLKNALEATRDGETVNIGVCKENDKLKFYTHNSHVIPQEAQLQIFQRSFSTKGDGRGLGTYSIKFLTERYLNGNVGFSSNKENGTEFYILLPLINESL